MRRCPIDRTEGLRMVRRGPGPRGANGRRVVDALLIRGRQLGREARFEPRVQARSGGEALGRPARAYWYYTDEQKVWVDPLRVTITPVPK